MTDWPFDPLQPMSCDVIVADPPWAFETYSEPGQKKGAAAHYQTMSTDKIAALPVSHLARGDSLLLLWCTGWAMATGRAQDVAKAWGFAPVTEIGWRRVTGSGKPRMGTGYRARTLHEPILLAITGNPEHRPFPSLFTGIAREHSRKPDEFYDIVRACTPKAMIRADLFSRQTRSGFVGWGNEKTLFDEVAA